MLYRFAPLTLLLLGACASTQNRESSEAELYGGLTEDEFAALHVLSGEVGPEPLGDEIHVGGTRAYLSLPEGEGPFPGVVVIHEWWGLNDHIRNWADRLAADGYAALAVDLYGGRAASTRDEAMQLMRAVDRSSAASTLIAAHAFLASDSRVQAPRTGCVGWCFGGGMSLLLAMSSPELDAAVMYYGRPVTDVSELRAVRAKVLAVFGSRDTSLPAATVQAFDTALAVAGIDYEILTYDAQHAFANPSSARYDAEAAGAAWERVRAFLHAELRDSE